MAALRLFVSYTGYAWLAAICFLFGCGQEKPRRLIPLIPFAEAVPDTEVLLFGGARAQNFLASWSEPRKQSGGRYRWSIGARPSISWNQQITADAYLHLRVTTPQFIPATVQFSEFSSPVNLNLDPSVSVQTISIPVHAKRAEFQLPPATTFGIHSAVITASRRVAEFRRIKEFPSVETLRVQGKNRTALVCETGGSISFYEMITPETVLEFGYYFSPSAETPDDSAGFSVVLTGPNLKQRSIFKYSAQNQTYGTRSISLRSYLNSSKPEPHKIEFKIARDTAFGNGKTAWIEPRLYHSADEPKITTSPLHAAFRNANVVLIILDAASFRRFGCYGYGRNTTPAIDAFAREGTQFYRSYTNAVYTLASSATTFTGLLPFRHGVLQHRNRLPKSAVTLPETLRKSGYETAAFLANGNVSSNFGLTQGFEVVREIFRDKNYVGRANDITKTFTEWFASRTNRKFFAYLHYREPHDPYQPPGEWVQKFIDPAYSGPVLKNFKDKKPIEKNLPGLTADDRKFISALYDANLAYGDSEVAKALRLLKESDVYDDTIVIITSDHGEAFWEHGYQGHNLQLYEESARVPMIVRFPRKAFHGKIHFPVQHADLYATIVDLLGLSHRGLQTDGMSFASSLEHGQAAARPILLQSTKRNRNALVSGNYKYIRNEDGKDELYDLSKDPDEKTNSIKTDAVRAGYLRQMLLKMLGSDVTEKNKPEEAHLDEAARENLKALGYLD